MVHNVHGISLAVDFYRHILFQIWYIVSSVQGKFLVIYYEIEDKD